MSTIELLDRGTLIISTAGKSRSQIIAEYIDTSYSFTEDNFAHETRPKSAYSSIKDFDKYLTNDDINLRINISGYYISAIDYIILKVISNGVYNYSTKNIMDNVKDVYALIHLFVKRGAKFNKGKIYDTLSIYPSIHRNIENNPNLDKFMDRLITYSKSTAAAAVAETRPASETVPVVGKTGCFGVGCSRKRSNRRRSTHRNRRNRSRKH